MVPRFTPDSRIQTRSVAPERASGSPDEKPRNITIRPRDFVYPAAASNHDGRSCASGETVIPLFAGFEPARAGAGEDIGIRRFVCELDILDSLATAHDLVGGYHDLLDVAIGLAEMLSQALNAIPKPNNVGNQ